LISGSIKLPTQHPCFWNSGIVSFGRHPAVHWVYATKTINGLNIAVSQTV